MRIAFVFQSLQHQEGLEDVQCSGNIDDSIETLVTAYFCLFLFPKQDQVIQYVRGGSYLELLLGVSQRGVQPHRERREEVWKVNKVCLRPALDPV